MRTSSAIKNSIAGLIASLTAMLLGFIAQAIFIRTLGVEYLGINGLFTNILQMLCFVELGIGYAIVFNLYKPIAEGNIEEIKSLMYFYKKTYRILAIIIAVLGMFVLPLIPMIVGEVSIEVNIYLVYFLFLMSTVASYLIVYKRNFIIADQKNYIVNYIHIFYLFTINLLQILIIVIYKNYYAYLITKIICQLGENIVVSAIANKKYPFLKEKEYSPLEPKIKKDIFIKVKALIYHKIGTIMVIGTDNIIISAFFGVATVGLYSNYYLIINALTIVFSQLISATGASVGNLLAKETQEKSHSIFKRMFFLNSWVSIFTASSLLIMIQPFMKIWVGEQYIFSMSILIILIMNYFQKMQKVSYVTFKDSAGIWTEDKYVPLAEAVLNITFSIFFARIYGIAGVFIGTILSSSALWFFSYPKYVYKSILGGTYKNYIKESATIIVVFIICCVSSVGLSMLVCFDNVVLTLFVNGIIALIVPNLILFVTFRKTDEFKYFLNLLCKIIFRKKKNETIIS